MKRVITENKLVRMIADRFDAENRRLYAPSDYLLAKRLYIYFMLGTYEPKRKHWEDYYDDRRKGRNKGRSNPYIP